MDRPAEPAAPRVRADYSLTAEDVARAFQLHNRALLRRWPSLVAGLVALTIVADAASIALAGDTFGQALVVGGGALGGIAVPLAMIRWVVPARARRLHARSRLLRTPVRLDADAAALRLAGPDAEIRTPWPDFVGWRENADTLLLYSSRAHFTIVPARALAPGARETLRRLYEAGRTATEPTEAARVAAVAEGRAPAEPLAVSRTWFVTRADLVAAQRLHLRRLWRRPRAFVAPLVFALCVGVAAAAADPTAARGQVGWVQFDRMQVGRAMLYALLLVAGLRAVSYGLLPLGARNFRRLQPNLALPWRVELDARGLRAITPQQDVRTAWGDYVAWSEDARVVLVYRSDAVFQFLPVRALDAAFLTTFRDRVAGLPRR